MLSTYGSIDESCSKWRHEILLDKVFPSQHKPDSAVSNEHVQFSQNACFCKIDFYGFGFLSSGISIEKRSEALNKDTLHSPASRADEMFMKNYFIFIFGFES